MLHDSILGVSLLLRQFQNIFAWWLKWKNLDSLDHYYLGEQIFLCEQNFFTLNSFFYLNKFVEQFFIYLFIYFFMLNRFFAQMACEKKKKKTVCIYLKSWTGWYIDIGLESPVFFFFFFIKKNSFFFII